MADNLFETDESKEAEALESIAALREKLNNAASPLDAGKKADVQKFEEAQKNEESVSPEDRGMFDDEDENEDEEYDARKSADENNKLNLFESDGESDEEEENEVKSSELFGDIAADLDKIDFTEEQKNKSEDTQLKKKKKDRVSVEDIVGDLESIEREGPIKIEKKKYIDFKDEDEDKDEDGKYFKKNIFKKIIVIPIFVFLFMWH